MGDKGKEVRGRRTDQQITLKRTEQLTRETQQLHVHHPMLPSRTCIDKTSISFRLTGQAPVTAATSCRRATEETYHFSALKNCLRVPACVITEIRYSFNYTYIISQDQRSRESDQSKASKNQANNGVTGTFFFRLQKRSQLCKDGAKFLR